MLRQLENQMRAVTLVERLFLDYPDIPIEAIFKEDILRRGVAWTSAALEAAAGYKRKAYFICSFDMVPIAGMKQEESTRAPEEMRLAGGAYGFKPVIVSVRLNPASPYS